MISANLAQNGVLFIHEVDLSTRIYGIYYTVKLKTVLRENIYPNIALFFAPIQFRSVNIHLCLFSMSFSA